MSAFISRVAYIHGTLVEDENSVVAMAPYYSGKKGFKTFQALINELKWQSWALNFTDEVTANETDPYTRLAFKVYQKKEAAAAALIKARSISGATARVTGSEASLDEAGYQEVAKLKDDTEMQNYIRRVLVLHHATIKDESQLKYFSKFYGSENRQML